MFLAGKRQIATTVVLFGVVTIFLAACMSKDVSVTAYPLSSPTRSQLPDTSTPSPTETPKPTQTVTITSTTDKVVTLASEYNVPGACLFTYLESNDKVWIAADCKLFRELIMAEKSSGKKIVVPYQEIDEEAPGQFSTRPLSWSSDNRYFYFTTRCCEYEDIYNSNGSLYQFDIEKEIWGILVHAVYEPSYFFSLDGERYVFLNHFPSDSSGLPEHLEIGIVNVLLNKNKRAVFRYIWGPVYDKPIYAWSENSDKFAIILHRLITLSEHTIESDKVLLKISFTNMDMELVEEFDINNLLEE